MDATDAPLMDEAALAEALGPSMTQPDDTDVAKLKRAWMNEKCAPEILQFQADLVARVTEQVEHQEATVSSARAAAAAAGGAASGGLDDLTAHIMHAELNRVRFMLRSYYRTRLHKIEAHVVHVVKETEVYEKLSPQEQEYAKDYANLIEGHFGSVLKDLPDRYTSMLQQIEEEDGPFDMVAEPNLDKHVFCRIKEDRGDFLLDPNDPDPANTVELNMGDIYLIRYRFIKGLLEEDALELI